MSLVLDAGAFLAIERGNRALVALVKREALGGRVLVTHGGVVGQVWRGGGSRQVAIAKLLGGVSVVPLDERLGRRAGALLAKTRSSDVIDAALVLVAADGDTIVTSDVKDLKPLAETADLHVDLVGV